MDYRQQLLHQLDELADQDLLRRCVTIDSAQGPTVHMADGSEKVLFCSNNYLNLAEDGRIRQAAKEALDTYGFGSVASRLISGTMTPHIALEHRFADFLHKEAALFFPSGWGANQALLTTLPQKGDLVLIDRFDHASIIDAVKASEAEFRTYRRGQIDKLEKYLSDSKYNNRYIVTESVFSMDGDTADLAKLVELKNQYNAVLIVDEAHALGCFGQTGAGLCEETGLLDEVDIIVAPLGKAVATGGGIVAGPQPLIDYLVNKARPFIYTTAPSPVIAAAAIKALEIIQTEPQRRQRLSENSRYLHEQFQQMGLDTGDSTTQIIPVILGEAAKAVAVSKALYDAGFFVSAIRPPTVAPGTARLRISVQANHTQAQLMRLCKAIRKTVI
ncbi:MAG: aminotransferase class I/II-fold pyridoxal phosphate-dependent enzyme [Planctomycetota bacterium]|jgi:8-amino-7-oxononanoate synthase